MHKLSSRFKSVDSLKDLYMSLVSEWQNPDEVVIGSNEPHTLLKREINMPISSKHELEMMYLDTISYLPDDILCKVDRASMSVGLETRIPMLDHRLFELAWRIPLSMKIRNGKGKWALRQVLYKYIPSELVDRPKAGFGIPIGEWLRGPLYEWSNNLLSETRLRSDGYFNVISIRKRWDEHMSGQRDWTHSLWAVLMFNMWLDSMNL
jgi:asparagine synthase (glutamine-hydrolysing)